MPNIDFANTCAWLDLLYGDCSSKAGHIVIVAASRNRLVGTVPVGKPDCLIKAAELMHDHPGCYLKINLMDLNKMQRRSPYVIGNRSEVRTAVSLHLDVDAGKSQKYASRSAALHALESMPVPPTLIINSNGDDGGFHAYWKLAKPVFIAGAKRGNELQTISTNWNKLLKSKMKGRLDSTGNIDRVLRCVGVPRADGGSVTMQSYEPDRLYQISDFT